MPSMVYPATPPSALQAAKSALSVARGPAPVERYGPLVLLVAGSVVAVAGALGFIPGGVLTATLTSLAGLGGFWVRHQA